MKHKILLLIVALLLLLCLISCTEHTEHEKGKNIERDEKYHWYPCEMSGCDYKLEKEEHTWDKGTVTVKPLVGSNGVKTYTCTKCGYSQKTEIKALFNKSEWEKAINSSSFKNSTIVFSETFKVENEVKRQYYIEANGNTMYYTITTYENGIETDYMGMYIEEALCWRYDSSTDTKGVMGLVGSDDVINADNLLVNYGIDILPYYTSFAYNYEKGRYEAENLEIGNTEFKSISVEFTDGKISALECEINDQASLTLKFSIYDYGKTVPKKPKN